MVRPFVPVMRRRLGVVVLGLMTGVFSASAAHAQTPPKNPYVFTADGALLLTFVKADHTADYEMVMGKVKEALAKSERPERKQQAANWKVYKAAEGGPGGSVIYVSVIAPAVKGSDYTVSTILSEAFSPAEVQDIYKKYADAFGSPAGNIMNLTNLLDLGK